MILVKEAKTYNRLIGALEWAKLAKRNMILMQGIVPDRWLIQ